ncbi:family 20 glycosylhydrolase [Luteipulveratus mongoliensis]|uniref:family 20 glycosylhydrolase n=1 Tax=Luteipulveratus mongoliensis TaxID=571913 RepID=UPI000696F695|nr:family 20 glycosylhydrolase [Luteipulveratus mongoliensis]
MHPAHPTRRTFVTGTAALVAAATTAPAGSARAEGFVRTPGVRQAVVARPLTVPGLQQWTAGRGAYRFGVRSRIVLDRADRSKLAGTAALFATDLHTLTGRRIPVVTGAARPGDLRLRLSDDRNPATGDEGYTLDSGAVMDLSAAAVTGIFRGTRTLLQLLHQSPVVAGGTAVDWPLKPYRGLMVDNGRKYFTPEWLEGTIRNMAYMQLNTLHLHLSDSEGFRIESSTHPEVVSKDGFLTKRQVRDLIALAEQHHIEIIPEIDVPGHMTQVLSVHPELGLPGTKTTLDLSKDEVYAFIKDLLDEYLPLFPGRYWMIGGDEADSVSDNAAYIAYAKAHYLPSDGDASKLTGNDCVLGFLNWANDIVRAHGKTMRMWNDGLVGVKTAVVRPSSTINIDFWTSRGADPQWLVDQGFTVMNGGSPPTYYAAGGGWDYRKDTPWTYDNWQVDEFLNWGADGETPSPFRTITGSANQGTAMHIWCDAGDAESEQHISEYTTRLTHIVAQAGWGSPKPAADYPGFVRALQQVGDAPGGLPTVDLAMGCRAVATTGQDPAAAVDDDPSTGWSSGSDGGRGTAFTIDLGEPVALDRAAVQWGVRFASAYRLELSADGRRWRQLASTSTGKGGTTPYRKATTPQDLIDFDPRAVGIEEFEHLRGVGRYVRLVVESAPAGGVDVMSLRLFGAPRR